MDELDKSGKLPGLKMPSKKAGNSEFSADFEREFDQSSSGLSDGENENEEFMYGIDGGEDLGSDLDSEEPNAAQNPEDEKASEKEEEKKEEEKATESESKSSEHDGKYFVIQKGMCQCDQGFKFPKFKVTSHKKHYWNDAEGQADYLAVTEDDLTLDPPAMPFGQCKLKPSSGGYLPCTYAPVGKWQKPYDKVKVMGHSCLTEISELMCAVGGKITIMKHGQQSEAGKSNATNASSKEQEILNPAMDYDEFKEEIEETDDRHAW